jgi:two-component system, LuxR family, response regulator FixJ
MEGGYLNNDSTVFIVDDDPGVRQSLTTLMRSMDLESVAFHSAAEFLDDFDPMQPGCLLLDVSPPGTNGLELLEHINSQMICLPAVVISAEGDVPTVVRAMRAGAFNFLKKPCRNQSLLESIQECFKWSAANRRRLVQSAKVHRRLERLTQGEYDVLAQIMEGKSNKAIAADLCVSIRAVEVRRSKLMKKMKAGSLADLIRMTMLIPIPKDEAFIKPAADRISKYRNLASEGRPLAPGKLAAGEKS